MYAAGCICIQEDFKLLANYTWVVFGTMLIGMVFIQ